MLLRIKKLHKFFASLFVWVVYYKKKLEKTESYMSQLTYTHRQKLSNSKLVLNIKNVSYQNIENSSFIIFIWLHSYRVSV